MKILDIGNTFDEGLSTHTTYFSDYYFLDADVIFIRLDAVQKEFEQMLVSNAGRGFYLPQQQFQAMQQKLKQRREQLNSFLSRGGHLFVFPLADPVFPYTLEKLDNGQIEARFDLYETVLLEAGAFLTQEVKGSNLRFSEPLLEDFFRLWDHGYDFIFKKFEGSPIAQVKNTNQAVALLIQRGAGDILLLPKLYLDCQDYNEYQHHSSVTYSGVLPLVEGLDRKAAARNDDLPEWAGLYRIGNERQEIELLEKLYAEKVMVEEAIALQLAELEKFRYYKQLLTASGKPLEQIVKFVFEEIGFEILPTEDNRDDLMIRTGAHIGVIEIKGVKGSASEQSAAQLMKWVSSYYADHGTEPKGILIVNAFRDKPITERTEKPFPTQMLAFAERMKFCLLTTTQLLGIYFEYEQQLLSLEDIQKMLFDHIGILNFSSLLVPE